MDIIEHPGVATKQICVHLTQAFSQTHNSHFCVDQTNSNS